MMMSKHEIIMNTTWFLRFPFAAVFLFHGTGKLVMPAMSADMLGLPVILVLLVGFAEVLAGVGAIVGGLKNVEKRHLVTRLSGLAAAPVLLGAIVMVHWPRWSFVATETHPMGGMEFQVVLLGIALFFLVGEKKEA
jgi:putative oxidoreductase